LAIFERRVDLAIDRIERAAGNADSMGLGQTLQTGSHVDAVSIDVVALDDDISQVDADTEPDAVCIGQVGLAIHHGALNVEGAVDGFDDAGKIGQKPVTHELHDASLAFRDLRLHQLFTEGLEAFERSRLVLAHEAREPDYVGGKNGGKPAFQALSP
jgi:hypothetical protein